MKKPKEKRKRRKIFIKSGSIYNPEITHKFYASLGENEKTSEPVYPYARYYAGKGEFLPTATWFEDKEKLRKELEKEGFEVLEEEGGEK